MGWYFCTATPTLSQGVYSGPGTCQAGTLHFNTMAQCLKGNPQLQTIRDSITLVRAGAQSLKEIALLCPSCVMFEHLRCEVLPVLNSICQEAEARHRSEKVSLFQSYKYDNTTAIDVLTILLYTKSTTAELALAVTVHHHASES